VTGSTPGIGTRRSAMVTTPTSITAPDERTATNLVRAAVAALATGCVVPNTGELFAEDYRAYGPGREVIGVRGARDARTLSSPLSGVRVHVHSVQLSPNGASARVTLRGRHTGQ